MIFYDTFRAGLRGEQDPHFEGLAPLLLTIHITNMAIWNLITTFLTNILQFMFSPEKYA